MASGQDALLLWCKENTKGYKHVDINDFEASWMNGMALAALVDKFMPGKLVYATLSPSRAEKNIQLALDVAERNGIPAIIDPEDILHPDKADKATLITYLSQFYKKFSAPRRGHPISVVIGKESTICPKCEKPLSGTTVQALARNWHTECFKCTKCDKSLVGGQVMNIQKEPYCSACGKASFESKFFFLSPKKKIKPTKFKKKKRLKILPFGMGGPPAIKIAREEKAEKEDAKENSPPGKPNKIDNSTLRGRAQGPCESLYYQLCKFEKKIIFKFLTETAGRRKPTRAADTAKTLKSKYAPPVYESLAVRTPNTKQHTRLSQLFNAPPATAAADYSIGSEDFAPSITKAQSQPVLSNVPAIASKSAEEISKPSTGGKISVDQFGPAPSPPTNSPPPVEALNLGPAPSPPTSPVPVVDIGNLGPAPLPPQPEPVEPAPIPDPSPLLSNDSAENNVATPPTVDKNNSCPVPLGDSVDKNEASDEEKENRPTSVSSKKPEELTPEEINLLLAEQERLREERKITNKSNWETSEREKIASYLQKKKEILAPVVVEEIIADPIGPTPIVNKKIAIPQESIKNWNNFKNEESQKKKESMHIEASKRSSEVEKQKMEEINLIKNRLAILDEFLEDGIVEHVVEYNWDDDMNVRIEGYLFKRDNVKSKLIQLQWRKRWFILQGSTFIYYHGSSF